jgi:hypothetical protein
MFDGFYIYIFIRVVTMQAWVDFDFSSVHAMVTESVVSTTIVSVGNEHRPLNERPYKYMISALQ